MRRACSLAQAGNEPLPTPTDSREALRDQDIRQRLRLQIKCDGIRRFVFLRGTMRR